MLGLGLQIQNRLTKAYVSGINYLQRLKGVCLDTSNSVWNDSSGNGLNANLVESNCAVFDGVNDYVSIPPYISAAQFNDPTFFIEWQGVTPATFKNYSVMYDTSEFILCINNTGKVSVFVSGGGTVKIGVNSLTTGTEYKIKAVFRGAANIDIYVNDVFSETLVVGYGVITDSTRNTIGAFNSGFSHFFNGNIYYVKVGTSTEVISNHIFSEGSGTTIYDVSGNANHGTAINITESNFWGTTQDVYHRNITDGFSAAPILTKTASTVWGNAGANSVETIEGDGAVSMVVYGNTANRMIGFSDSSPDDNYNTIDFAIYAVATGYVKVFEGGSGKFTGGVYADGDVLKVTREGSAIKYYQNDTLIYTSTASSTGTLLVDCALHSNTGTIYGATLNNEYITWENVNGCDESTISIPALSDSSGNDALGNPLTNPAIQGHNGAETKVLLNPTNNAQLLSKGITDTTTVHPNDSLPVNVNQVLDGNGNVTEYNILEI